MTKREFLDQLWGLPDDLPILIVDSNRKRGWETVAVEHVQLFGEYGKWEGILLW